CAPIGQHDAATLTRSSSGLLTQSSRALPEPAARPCCIETEQVRTELDLPAARWSAGAAQARRQLLGDIVERNAAELPCHRRGEAPEVPVVHRGPHRTGNALTRHARR